LATVVAIVEFHFEAEGVSAAGTRLHELAEVAQRIHFYIQNARVEQLPGGAPAYPRSGHYGPSEKSPGTG
jgi:hypothetical protein